ncbi:hypothetical protein [Caballeronia sp. J97]|uniref:hypothetical protein n=1 Tax=Caballeronia sp. J97 TaxID=2805429 RepID=UPI002AAFF3CA|nr:hypothetical protein [Caballeronia sp. J97]
MKTIVSPSDCAVAIGVPLTRERFVQRFDAAEEGSFIFEYLQSGRAPERDAHAAWNRWSDTAGQMERALKQVERKGVTVRRDASLQDLLALIERFEVVTVVSHWRSAIFRRADLPDPQAVDIALADPGHALHRAVMASTNAPPRGDDRLAVLNRALFADTRDVPLARPHQAPPGRLSELQSRWHERRLQLEACGPGLFRGGASIEFAEGLQTVETIVAGIPKSYDRLLDLTVCTCVLLATRIKQQAPACHVACNEQLTYPLPRMLMYRYVVDWLSKHPGAFEDAVFKVRARIQSEVDHERNKAIAGPLFGQRTLR